MDKGKLAVLGLFFAAFVAASLILASFFKDLKGLFGSKSSLYVTLDSAEGLKEGDDVLVKGVKAGSIEDISFSAIEGDKEKILVKVKLHDRPIKFYMSYKIKIVESSLIGGKYLSIVPRDPEEVDPEKQAVLQNDEGLSPEKALKGNSDPSGFAAINEWLKKNGSKFGDAFSKLEELLDQMKKGSVGKVLTDEGELYKDIKSMTNNAAETFTSAREIMDKVRKGEGTIGKLVFEDKLYNDLSDLTNKAKNIADRMDRGEGTLGKLSSDSKLYDDLADVMGAAKDLLNKMRTGEGTVGALLNERDLYDEMRETTTNLREISRKIANGQGMAGRIVNDEELGSDFKDAVREFKEMTHNMNNVTKRLDKGEGTIGRMMSDDSLYRKADQAVDSLNKTLGSLSSLRTTLGVEYKHFFDTGVNAGMGFIDVYPAENKFLHIGAMSIGIPEDSSNLTQAQLENDGNENLGKLDVQLGYKFLDNRLTLRAGLLEGKVGGGIDYDWAFPGTHHDIRFTVEGRDAYNDVDDEDYDEHAGTIWSSEISSKVWKYLRLEAGISRIGENSEIYTGFVFEWEDDDIRKLVGLLSAAK